MALVAFDLDNTLGSFDAVGPWGEFFSVEMLENGSNRISLTPTLKSRLRKAEDMLVEQIKANKGLFELIFRPNLDALIVPLVKAKRSGKVRAVCMYSNTSCTFSMYFAKRIIEDRYNCPDFFDCVVDVTHPIRKYDWNQNKIDKIQPLKTFVGLKRIFRTLCGVTDDIYPARILFIDDRSVKHHLAQEEKDGLVYLLVTPYIADISQNLRKQVYLMGLQVLMDTHMVDYPAYLSSKIFHTDKHALIERNPAVIDVNGFFNLLALTEKSIMTPYFSATKFKDDTVNIRRVIIPFLRLWSKQPN